jgi:hypothetical protein
MKNAIAAACGAAAVKNAIVPDKGTVDRMDVHPTIVLEMMGSAHCA